MPENQFTHVCSACHTPVLKMPQRAERAWQTVALSVVVFIFVLAFAATIAEHYRMSMIELFAIGILIVVIGMFFWSHFKRKGIKTCPACQSVTLLPVGSPEGLRIMKELGYVES